MRNFLIAAAAMALLIAVPAMAQWAAEPGATVRNAFGPQAGHRANQCRGACGAGCPDSCAKTVAYECTGASQLRRVESYQCGTHQGCRVHDDCLDTCLQKGIGGDSCARQCDSDVTQRYGFESAGSWLAGRGPYDGQTTFEYSRDAPDALEAAYRCPEDTSRQCNATPGCLSADGRRTDPVFDRYAGAAAASMQVSALRLGPLCDNRVCAQSADIQITGADSCSGRACTRFGMEFDYRNADPAMPLQCTPSTSGGDSDFINTLLKQGADAMTSRGGTSGGPDGGGQKGDGMAGLLGVFAKVVASADSAEDVDISMAPLDENGNPIESQRVGSTPRGGQPPIPRSVDLDATSGHLLVPMYQMADGQGFNGVKERRVSCTHNGQPVLVTVFRLHGK